MKSKYSIAICPPDNIVEEIRQMKERLFAEIGWFASRRSEAHITINLFEADESELQTWKQYLEDFCKTIEPFEIRLTKTGSNSSGAFFLAPDDESAKHLIGLMRKFHEQAPL